MLITDKTSRYADMYVSPQTMEDMRRWDDDTRAGRPPGREGVVPLAVPVLFPHWHLETKTSFLERVLASGAGDSFIDISIARQP